MTPRPPLRTTDSGRDSRGSRGPREPPLEARVDRLERSEAQLRELTARLARAESRQLLLENTLRGVAREAGVQIGCPCDRCDRSALLIADGMMRCPACGYRQSI